MPVVLLFATMTMLVLRAGASRIFFDVVGSFQATRLIGDAQAKITVLQGLVLDGLSGITEGVGLIAEQLQEVVDSTVPLAQEIGYARIEFEKFVSAADDAEVMGRQIENLGLQFGFAGDQALAAGAKMAQLSSVVGGGAAIPAATEIGIAFGMVGGMETEEAMKKMIALQQQTGFMFGELTEAQYNRLTAEEKANVVRNNSITLLNQLNTVENRSSATMAQVTFVMNQFASSAKLAGDEITYMAAASATLIEAGEEQGKAGRALKMMYARLGADTGNNSKILEKYGVATKGANGELRTMSDIIGDASDAINKLAKDQQAQAKMEIAQAIAGNDHYVRAIKLIEGKSRTMQLERMAIQELDEAQEELNKRFEDNAFLLTQAEANLTNAKAALGQQFTPAVIQATNAQAALTLAMAEFVEIGSEIPILGDLFGMAFDMAQLGRVYAPFVEANLNIMSLNVSLQTQLQIQRALSGENIVRASAYGQQGTQLRANLNTVSQTAAVRDREALMAANMIRIQGASNNLDEAGLRLVTGKVTNNRAALMAQKTSLQNEIAEIQAKKQKNQLQQTLNTGEFARTNKVKETLRLREQEMRLRLNEIPLMTKGQALLQVAHRFRGMELKTEEQLKEYKANSLLHGAAEKAMREHNLKVSQQRANLENTIASIQQRRNSIQFGLTEQEENELKAAQANLAMTNQQLQLEGKRAIMTAMVGDSIQDNVTANSILTAAYHQVGNAVRQNSSAEAQNDAIMDAAAQAARELAMAFNLDEKAILGVVQKLPPFTAGLKQVAAQSDATVKQSMALNNRLMMMSGTLGGLSMAFGMFTDDSKAAKISMFLLNVSMIPMTIQMFTATKASYGLMAGFTAAGAAANQAAVATTRFNMALKVSGAMIVLAGISYLIYKIFPDLGDAADESTASLDKMNQTMQASREMYDAIAADSANASIAQMSARREQIESDIARQKQILANQTEPTILKLAQQRLDLLKQELGVVTDITALKQAQLFSEDEASAQRYFNQIKDIQSIESDFYSQRENEGRMMKFGRMLESGGFFIAETVVEGLTDNEIVTHVEAMEGRMADAFAAIPEHLHGAIMEAALASESFEEFQDQVARMADEQNFTDPFSDFAIGIEENFIGPIEAAKEAAFEFGNAREEMFFGMSKGNITGDMVKQVVNKGVETLINTTEVIMTNNFTGMTTTQAANEITKQVVSQLNGLGLNLSIPA